MQAVATEPLSGPDVISLSRACGLRLDAYRPEHVSRAVGRAVARNGVGGPRELAGRLREDAAARRSFRRLVLVPVTRMFRDEDEFAILERTVLPELLARKPALSVWSAGCATGEELRSVAVLLERRGALAGSRLLGTDILDEALADAAPGLRIERGDLLTDDAPAGPFDLVLCRNVSIYFAPVAQDLVRRKLVGALASGGFLMLGRAETVLDPGSHGLTAVGRHVYRRNA